MVVQMHWSDDEIHQWEKPSLLSALVSAVLEGFGVRSRTVLSLIQLSKSIGDHRLAKVILQ